MCVCVCALEIIIQAEFHINSCECVPVSPLPMSHEFWLFVFVRVFEIFLHRCNTTLPTLMWIQQEKQNCFVRLFVFSLFLWGLASLLPQKKNNKWSCAPSLDIKCVSSSLSHCLYLSNFPPIHKYIWIWNLYISHTHTHTPTRV